MNKIFLTMLIALSLIGIASAFPLQLLPNGSLIEVNYTINGTPVDFILFNDTIYLVEANLSNHTIYQNITYQNVTNNITYVNMTCLNCTNYYNETINNTYYDYGYNRSYVDNNFLLKVDFDSFKNGLTYATKDELTNSINNLNVTSTNVSEGSVTWLWISVLGLFLMVLGIIGFLFWMIRGGE